MKIKKVVTFGSCLSASVANVLEETSSYYRLSSVQHNRIDQFMENYIYKTTTPLRKEDLNLKVKEQFSNVNVFRNQFEEVELGKALPFKKKTDELMHTINAIVNEEIDVLLIDNYPDLFFKVYKHKKLGAKFFVNKSYLEEEPLMMEFVNELLDPKKAVKFYEDLIEFSKANNKELITIFMNFPTNLKDNKALDARGNVFFEEMNKLKEKSENIFIIPPWQIKIEDLTNPNDPYHFTNKKYSEYAQSCNEIISQMK